VGTSICEQASTKKAKKYTETLRIGCLDEGGGERKRGGDSMPLARERAKQIKGKNKRREGSKIEEIKRERKEGRQKKRGKRGAGGKGRGNMSRAGEKLGERKAMRTEMTEKGGGKRRRNKQERAERQ